MKEENVIAFSWEPRDKRFALIHQENATPTKSSVSFYTMGIKAYKHLKTLEKRSANHLFWSPQGKYIVIAGLRNLNGVLEFFNTVDMETMSTDDHFMCTNVDWDPTGRFIATQVSYWYHQMENGYNLWSFQGRLLHSELKEKFYQLLWRPRPPSLLTKEKEEFLKKNFKQFSDKYRQEDTDLMNIRLIEERKRKQKLRDEFENLMKERMEEYKSNSERRKKIRGGVDSDNEGDYKIVEEEIEEVLEQDEHIIE